jgi:5-(aminomethyl)-3-furanmethanol phosphate kinase
MTPASIRVIKLGGSLLGWPQWPIEFRTWRARQSPAADVLVVGGGALVDALREWDRAHCVSTAAAHWLAVGAMGLTARMALELLPDTVLVNDETGLHRDAEGSLQVFDCERILQKYPADLPHNWHVTSDSIAAYLAKRLEASELVLLKSTLPVTPGENTRGSNYVDAYFSTAARGLSVRCVNLRDSNFAETSWPTATD